MTRAEWGARRPVTVTRIPRTLGFAVHWEGPTMGRFDHDRCAGKVRGIQDFHMDERKWSDIAYSFVVCPHGFIYEGRGWGVRTAANGTNHGNDNYLAACYLGGMEDPFTDEAKLAYHALFTESRRRYSEAEIRPHSSFKPTLCPGDPIRAWLAGGCPLPVPTHEEADVARFVIYWLGPDAWLADFDRGVTVKCAGPSELEVWRSAGFKEHPKAKPAPDAFHARFEQVATFAS